LKELKRKAMSMKSDKLTNSRRKTTRKHSQSSNHCRGFSSFILGCLYELK